MKWTAAITAMVLACGLSATSFAQGGQERNMREMDGSVRRISEAIDRYLNSAEMKSVLTPGEYAEFPLKLKPGQVVVAEASSDAFDPALQIVDGSEKVLAFNDDRYPGDQRPLLLWRCEKGGEYELRIRCFHDKSGGQFFVRFQTYDSLDLGTDQKVDQTVVAGSKILLRVPMKAGQIKQVLSSHGGAHRFARLSGLGVIAPGGLPDIDLARPIQAITSDSLIAAPVEGDYYLMAQVSGGSGEAAVEAWAKEIETQKPLREGSAYISKAPTRTPTVWEISVKKGDFLEASTADLSLNCEFVVAEEPAFPKFDVSKPDLNPFFPQKHPFTDEDNSPIETLPARARDGRFTVFYVKRDAKLWLASNGAGPADKEYLLRVEPAAKDYIADRPVGSKLVIGNTDYWALEAKAGDVMSLKATASGFSQVIAVRDPDLQETVQSEAKPDQTTEKWQMIVQKPGRYLVSMSCLGDGGSGDYYLDRQVLHAAELSKSSPASADISDGQIQVWKFTVKAGEPELIRWTSTHWDYDVAIYDEKGVATQFQRDSIDPHTKVGILSRPQSYVIVLSGKGPKATYSIDLSPLPGYKPAGR